MVLALDGLTEKQEKFADCLFQGMTQADAYRAAYDCAAMSDSSVWEEASRVAANLKVSARVRELAEAAGKDDRLIASVVERKHILSERYRAKEARNRDVNALIHTHNLMDRLYKPDDSPTNAGQVVIINVIAPGAEVKQIVTGERLKLPDHTVS